MIVYKLERFARDELTDFAAYAEIKNAGAELVSATENIDGTPQGMLMHGMLTAINAYYSRDLAGKITDGRITKAKLGGSPGRVPLGYLNKRRWDGANDIRYVEIDPIRAPHIQWAFEAYATGKWSMRTLAEELYKRGLRSRPTPKRSESKVNRKSVEKILRNPYYAGIVKFRGVQYQGSHPRFISDELFDRVKRVRASHTHSSARHRSHDHYLKGVLCCGRCGRKMIFTKCTGRHGAKFDYFVCSGRHRESACDLPYLKAHEVEQQVASFYGKKVNLDANRLDELEPRLIREMVRACGSSDNEAIHFQKEVDELMARRDLLVEGHLENPKAIPLDVLEKKQADLDSRLDSAKENLRSVSRQKGKPDNGLERTRQLLRRTAGGYGEVDDQTRGTWNRVLFGKLFVNKEGVVGSEPTREFATLLREDLDEVLRKAAKDPQLQIAGGSIKGLLVELRGLEPLTFALPARRSSS